jgi:hypothetical protein
MTAIRLEFSKLQILKGKERWRLYFIVVAEHPDDNDKMVVTTFPDPYIRLKPTQDNFISFEPEGNGGADGLFVIERAMPTDKQIKVRMYLRHSRQKVRDLGKSLSDLKTALGGDAFEIVGELFGTANPWLVVAKKALPMLGTVLSGLGDRDLGFITMDESFDKAEEQMPVLERTNNFSTGEAKIWWKWKIEE